MPTCRSITTSLVSQFDLKVVPEHPPPQSHHDPSVVFPPHVNEELSVISVFIPIYPCSQFWVSYSIAPPHPPQALYYFKLFLNGACVVSWGCGRKDQYRGKTMFGLYESEAYGHIQKRILCFGEGCEGSDDDVLEMKVYRCKGRKRCSPILDVYGGEHGRMGSTYKEAIQGNMSLINIGDVDEGHAQNYYIYGLIDPLDKPFATLRYYYRTWGELQKLGVVPPSPSCSPSRSFGAEDEEEIHQGTPGSALLHSSNEESSPHRSLSESLAHLRPLISRGGGNSPPPPLPSSILPSPSPSPPLQSQSQSSSAAITTSPSTPRSSKHTRTPSVFISDPTRASVDSLTRSATSLSLSADFVPPAPRLYQRQKAPRPASLDLLKSVVVRAVRRRETGGASSRADVSGKTEREILTERLERNESSKKLLSIPRRTSSSQAATIP